MRKLLIKVLPSAPTIYVSRSLRLKVINNNLRNKNSAHTLINTERFKNTFISRLICRYKLNIL